MNIGMLLLVIIGGFAGLFLHFIFVSVFHSPLYGTFHRRVAKVHPDYEIAVSFNILIPNKNNPSVNSRMLYH